VSYPQCGWKQKSPEATAAVAATAASEDAAAAGAAAAYWLFSSHGFSRIFSSRGKKLVSYLCHQRSNSYITT